MQTCHGCRHLKADKPRDGTGDAFLSCGKFHEVRGVSVNDPSGVTKTGRRFSTYTEMHRLWEKMDTPVEVEPLVVEYVRRREQTPTPKTSDCKEPPSR